MLNNKNNYNIYNIYCYYYIIINNNDLKYKFFVAKPIHEN